MNQVETCLSVKRIAIRMTNCQSFLNENTAINEKDSEKRRVIEAEQFCRVLLS